MSKQPSKTIHAFEVTIEKLVYGGAGFARYKGKVVFVPFSAPGDRLLVRPFEEKKTFVRAEIVRVLKPGSGRADPVCAHFAKCGGCHWQQLEYSHQVRAKQQILEEIFHHRFPQTRDLPIAMKPCTQPLAYRSRARVQMRGAGPGASVGFFRCGSHTIENVESCPLFRGSLNEALSSLRQYKLKVDTDPKPREMDMACSEEEDAWTTAHTESIEDSGIATLLGERRKDVVLRRKIGEFTYSVTASVFFQANDFVVPELVAVVQESAQNAGNSLALDLFAGVGLFSLPLARRFARVVAIENSPAAVRLCSRNAQDAGVGNIMSVCSDVLPWLKSREKSEKAPFDLVVLDPPRMGAGPETLEQIRELAPKNIIYVSCDPQTLVRDLVKLSPGDYRISLVQGLDMFPQTYHFETVVRLERN
jgi:23S rRNA (uracil1939-C5)-methyltransferase